MLTTNFIRLAAAVIMVGTLICPVQAQTQSTKKNQPNAAFVALLIKNTLVTLNNAWLTGNYTVLRELGTADFQGRNSSELLFRAFAKLQARRINLSSIVNTAPKLTKPPAVKNRNLRLVGFVPLAQSHRVNFNIVYSYVNKRWRMQSLSVSVSKTVAQQSKKKN